MNGTLDDYLTKYGAILGRQAHEALVPLHDPSNDPVHPALDGLKRKPMDAQAHVITAGVKAMRCQRALLVVGEMGTGKTIMGQAIHHAHAGGRAYRALVMCPGQLVRKWERELRLTIPGIRVVHLESWRDVLRLRRERGASLWCIIGRDRAKLGFKRADGFARRRAKYKDQDGNHKIGVVPCCPQCGQPVVNKEGVLITPDARKKPLFCQTTRGKDRICGAALWQASPELRRMEPAKLIHKKLKGFFDYLILDEIHEEKSADSAQANAAGSLIAAAKKVIAMTGTLVGGYAEHIRPLLFRLAPRSLVAEGLS